MLHHDGIVLKPDKRRTYVDATPRRVPMFTDTPPTSKAKCWRILYFVLIENEARPHPEMTPVTYWWPAMPPDHILSPLRPSFNASLSRRLYLLIFSFRSLAFKGVLDEYSTGGCACVCPPAHTRSESTRWFSQMTPDEHPDATTLPMAHSHLFTRPQQV